MIIETFWNSNNMAKKRIRIKYPATVFISKFVLIEEKELTEMLEDSKLASDFIYEKVMSESERNYTEKSSLECAYSLGYAKIETVKPK